MDPTTIAAATAAIKPTLDIISGVIAIAEQSKDVTIKEKMLPLRENIITLRECISSLREENLSLHEEIKSLKKKLENSSKLKFKNNVLYDGDDPNPYCPVCNSTIDKLVRLTNTSHKFYQCGKCKNTFSTNMSFISGEDDSYGDRVAYRGH